MCDVVGVGGGGGGSMAETIGTDGYQSAIPIIIHKGGWYCGVR